MCGEIFWKKVLVFCLTFGLGVLVSGLFIPKELPAQNTEQTISPIPAENKNCIPVDGNPRYETLDDKAPNGAFQSEEPPKLKVLKKFEADKKSSKNKREKQNSNGEPEKQPDIAPKDSAEYRDLLHREKCFEAPPQK